MIFPILMFKLCEIQAARVRMKKDLLREDDVKEKLIK
jgi:hypothetical protein